MKTSTSLKITIFIILLLALLFRTYKLETFYSFGHDQDLFAWIAKDIVSDHHLRLIGQETSVTGVFIGPLFYYLIALSFTIFGLDPLSANIPTIVTGLLTTFSIYWIFSKFFGRNTGLIGSFLYAVSPGVVFLDRWVVPTQPTILWTVWYLYILLSILKGNFQILIPLGILIGLVWHIHIAFIPLLTLLPVAFWLSKKEGHQIQINLKDLVIPLLLVFTLLLPFFAFEARHNFLQTKSLFTATQEERGDLTGSKRLLKTLDAAGKSLSGIFLLNNETIILPPSFTIPLPILLLFLIIFLSMTKLLAKSTAIISCLWIVINLISQFLSKRAISEYYLNNLFAIFFLVSSVCLAHFHQVTKKIHLVPLLLVAYLFITTFWILTRPDALNGYLQKRKTVEYIQSNARAMEYPCIAINYIEEYKGIPNGFRYLFWWKNLTLITPGNDIPVYSIVTPWKISEKEVNDKFGIFGVILPAQKIVDPKICNEPSRQLLPLWGFTN